MNEFGKYVSSFYKILEFGFIYDVSAYPFENQFDKNRKLDVGDKMAENTNCGMLMGFLLVVFPIIALISNQRIQVSLWD
ncbi:hypothetical protein EU528_14765 [Candidatus Thorarchaeota archaeon]|nr:MAG: hypothetical protein EU528_14765 [Candidatus Thorarchaeota archaeon]